MFKNIFNNFSKSIGIDLGTANTLVYVKEKGIVISEPSVVAINMRTEQILSVGKDAKNMLGKTPGHITTIRPLVGGIISDFEVTEKMLKYFIDKVHQKGFGISPRPQVIIGVPLDVTEVEKKAVADATLSAGARQVFLVEEPMSAAIGSRLPILEPVGNMIVDIGGGSTDIAVISLGGIVTWRQLKTAGDDLNESITRYARENFNILLGEKTAELIKIKIGSASGKKEPNEMSVRGRDLISGLPKEITITADQVRTAIIYSLKLIIENIKTTLENTPPELVADIYQKGILLTGGGALLKGLDNLIAREVKIPVQIADDPLTCMVRGTGMILEDFESLKDVLINAT